MIDTTNRNTALASALVEELARGGVRRAFLSPGSRSSPVALALDREPGIELSVILDERSAGFAALGAALATGAPTVVACTSGSAAANFHPAVVEADQAGVPMIVLTSDRPPELRGIGAGQTIDQIGLYGTASRGGSARSAPTTPTISRTPAHALDRLPGGRRGDGGTRPGPPQPRLAGSTRAGTVPRRRDRHGCARASRGDRAGGRSPSG